MTITALVVDKNTDQMRSAFVAYGLADLLFHLDRAGSGIEVWLCDLGSAYGVEVNRSRDDLLAVARERGLPALLPALVKPPSATEKTLLEQGVSSDDVFRKYIPSGFPTSRIVNYGEERQKAQEWRQTRRGKTREAGDTLMSPPDYPLWAHLCSYFGRGSAMRIGYPLVIHAWHAHQGEWAEALCDLILRCYGTFPNDVDTVQAIWGDEFKPRLNYTDFGMFGWGGQDTAISALSVVSPTTAKGSFTVTGASGLNNDTPDIFWLEMYLAFAGYMVGAMPFNASGDALLYYPLPLDISFAHLGGLMRECRDSGYVRELYEYSNVMPRSKIDALSQIAFSISMTRHCLATMLDPDTPPWEPFGANAISGLVGYYYKDISTQIPFDETTFALPMWLPLKAETKALEEALGALEAHHDLIAALREGGPDELAILAHYRRFITFGDADDWIEFAVAYSQHRVSNMVDASWMPHLQVELLERTLMNNTHKDYRPLLENPGFRAIAAAIRHCTAQTRYFKDVKNRPITFNVRHGLGDDLRRRAHDADCFIEDLSHFVYDYMRESSRVQATTGETRPFITDADLADAVTLVEQYGSRVVANLLVAMGYASSFTRRTEQA